MLFGGAALACLLLSTLDCFKDLQLLTSACKLATPSTVFAQLGQKTLMFLKHQLPMIEMPGGRPQAFLKFEVPPQTDSPDKGIWCFCTPKS